MTSFVTQPNIDPEGIAKRNKAIVDGTKKVNKAIAGQAKRQIEKVQRAVSPKKQKLIPAKKAGSGTSRTTPKKITTKHNLY